MAKQSWYAMKALAKTGEAEISIYDEIGTWGVTAQDFKRDLVALGDVDVMRLRIGSPGGEVSQGFMIFNMLDRHPARKIVTVDGLAASMASVIAMAGDEIEMPRNSLMMIHNPTGSMWDGTADQFESYSEAIRKMENAIADAYVKRSGAERAEIVSLMNRETWLTAEEAVELGLADRVAEPVEARACFDISKFHKVPAAFGRAMEKIAMKTKSKTARNATKTEAETEVENEDEEALQASQEVRDQIKAQNKEIRSVCALAGKADLADGFIDEDLSVSEVVAKLDEIRQKEAADKKKTTTSRAAVSEGVGGSAKIDPTAIYAKYNNPKKQAA